MAELRDCVLRTLAPVGSARRRVLDALALRLFGRYLKNTASARRARVRERLADYERRSGRVKLPLVDSAVTLIGHVFAPTGRGEDVRACFRALRAVGVQPRLVDIHGLGDLDTGLLEELWANLGEAAGSRLNIFFINADEVESVLALLKATGRHRPGGFDVVYPVWELEEYPEPWARELDRFDEIWVPTRFIYDSIAARALKPVVLVPFASGFAGDVSCDRARLALPEGRFLFLFFFDFSSFMERKNPFAVVRAFERFRVIRPGSEATLILKLSGAHPDAPQVGKLRDMIAPLGNHVLVIDRILTGEEMGQLLACCDSFVSLHRSEGFGRGLAEAMSLGKPVIATGYSGNADFMDRENSLLVDYELVAVPAGDYPFAAGQVWAEANVEQAAEFMALLSDDPAYRKSIGARAKRAIEESNGYRSVGELIHARIAHIERSVRS